MKTMLLNGHDADDIARAANLLRQGELVVFPTDTVYGIGVDARQKDAIDRLYAAKQRSYDLGIPVLIADSAELETLADLPDYQRDWINTLTTQFWPGPLTLVLPRHSALPANISPNDGIAVRIPDNTIVRKLIRATGGAIAATSANLSGEQPALNGGEAIAIFNGIAAAILDGGTALGGVPSTVFDCRHFPPRVLRSGPISARVLHPEPEQLR